ncbi:MAG: VOC family protein [Methyloceanibacter sp.]|nr:VOC family protein [Methyloceanibacter sp.]
MPVTRLLRVVITVADLECATSFFREGLGLEVGPAKSFRDARWNALLGLSAVTKMRTADVSFAGETLKLAAFDPAGSPYPRPRASNDLWFEHVALVAGDIGVVWSRLEQHAPETVTAGGPVLLPPNTGSVTAFKFRDPEGHPLELISFPVGVGDTRWQRGDAGIRGFDHTAIVVSDLDRSLAFYTELLGMRVGGHSLNQGPEQDHLDGLSGCLVDVVALQPLNQPTPHVELLHYRTPQGAPSRAPLCANDVASVRQVHQVDDLPMLVQRLNAAGTRFVSDGTIGLGEGRQGAAIRDPDGHMIVLLD